MRARLLLAGLLVPAAAMAAVEVTPLAGYRAGGLEVDTGLLCIQYPCATFAESDDSPLYGVIVGVPINDVYQFEFLVNRQLSEVFHTFSPGGPRAGGATGDFDVTHAHAGASRRWRLKSFEPFVALGGGQTWIEAPTLLGGSSERRWSGSATAGARVPLGSSDRYGLRFEARGYLVDLPSQGLGDNETLRSVESALTQFETTFGVTFRF